MAVATRSGRGAAAAAPAPPKRAPTSATGLPIVLSPQCTLHDRANLLCLPLIGSLVVAGLLGAVDTMLVRSLL